MEYNLSQGNYNQLGFNMPNSILGNTNLPWNDLPWKRYEYSLLKTQNNVFLATKSGDTALARNWQNYILNCFEYKLLAVRQITQLNKGKKTKGVDDYIAIKDNDRYQLASSLVIDGLTNIIRRTYIPKPGSKDLCPLGIPTIFDRCKQCLVKFAIEPEFEAKFDFMSFGFRPGRKAMDATQRIRSHMMFNGPCWVLDADIIKCFDRIKHDYILGQLNDALPIVRLQISAWLKAEILDPKGFIDNPLLGTPQGGPISSLLCNIALNGFQKTLFNSLKSKFGYQIARNTIYIRYADDFVFLGPNEEVVLYAKECFKYYLAFVGLELNEIKTKIIHTLNISQAPKIVPEYFDFLGFTYKSRYVSKHKARKISSLPSLLPGNKSAIIKNRVKTYMVPSTKRINRHKASIKALMEKISNAEDLIKIINPRIKGWVNYFKYSDAKLEDLPRKMDLWMNSRLRKWIRRTTKQRGKVETFWRKGTKDWVFEYTNKKGIKFEIAKYSNYKWNITRYKPINVDYNPYSDTLRVNRFQIN